MTVEKQPLARNPQDSWEETIAQLLAEAEAVTDRHERARRLQRVAEIYETEAADPDKAFAVWQAAFIQDFCNQPAACALERLAEHLGNAATLVADLRPLVEDEADPRQRASLLAWIGRWSFWFAGERAAAEALLTAALGLDPTSSVAVRTLRELSGDQERTPPPLPRAAHRIEPDPGGGGNAEDGALEKLDLHVAARRWPAAVDVLAALAQASEAQMRVRYLAAAAKILYRKLGQTSAAVAMLNRALDAAPDDLTLFEDLQEILCERKAWPDLEANLQRMIARLEAARVEDRAAKLAALWLRLADLYRERLDDPASAARAHSRGLAIDPQVASRYPASVAETLAPRGQ
jgi:tetratricopeptide (TPR) repeat protein